MTAWIECLDMSRPWFSGDFWSNLQGIHGFAAVLTFELQDLTVETARRGLSMGGQVDKILLKHTVTMLVELGVQGKNVFGSAHLDSSWLIDLRDHEEMFYDVLLQYSTFLMAFTHVYILLL